MASSPDAGRAAAREARLLLTAAAILAATLAAARPVAAQSADSAAAEPMAAAASRDTVPQHDVFDVVAKLLGKEPVSPEIAMKPRRGLSITLLPAIGYNPAYGAYAGVTAAVGGWLGEQATTSVSAGSASVTYSTSGQLSAHLKTDFFTADNSIALKGDWRYLDTNQPTYGLGPATSNQDRSEMDFRLIRFYETVYWHVPKRETFIGFGYHFDRWSDIVEPDAPDSVVTDYRRYSGGAVSRSTASGWSLNVLYDTRDNIINARKGMSFSASFRSFVKGLGSDSSWQAIMTDFRVYPTVPPKSRNTLAVWNYTWFTFGHAPYLNLPATGWDTYGRGARGYLQGRIRGEDQMYTEVEYRAPLRRDGLVGGVLFVNGMLTSENETRQLGKLDLGFGGGLRFKFNKRTSTNLAVDVASDKFGVAHVFFGMQEVF